VVVEWFLVIFFLKSKQARPEKVVFWLNPVRPLPWEHSHYCEQCRSEFLLGFFSI
jgi:hypothetical protein